MGASSSSLSSNIMRIVSLLAGFIAYKWVSTAYEFHTIINVGAGVLASIIVAIIAVFFTAALTPEKKEETGDN